MFAFNLLQRRLFREMIHVFILCVVGLLALMLMGQGVHLRELFFGLQIELPDLLLLFAYLSPTFLLLVVPIACMLCIFLTFLRMSSDRELIALKAGGVSLYQMLPAPMIFSALCAVLTLWVSVSALPSGMAAFRASVVEIASTRAKIVLQPGTFSTNVPGLTIFARQVNAEDNEMQGVFIEDKSDSASPLAIIAPRGNIGTDVALGALLLNLYDGTIYQTQNGQISTLNFSEYTVRLELDSLFSAENVGLKGIKPKEMGLDQLREVLRTGQPTYDQRYVAKAAVEIQKRFVFPVACLVLGLFAMPLACSFEGMRRHFGIVLTLVMFMVYYSLLSFAMTLGQSGDIPIEPGMWLPNIVFFCAALFGLRQAARERTLGGLFSRRRSRKQRRQAT